MNATIKEKIMKQLANSMGAASYAFNIVSMTQVGPDQWVFVYDAGSVIRKLRNLRRVAMISVGGGMDGEDLIMWDMIAGEYGRAIPTANPFEVDGDFLAFAVLSKSELCQMNRAIKDTDGDASCGIFLGRLSLNDDGKVHIGGLSCYCRQAGTEDYHIVGTDMVEKIEPSVISTP